MYEHLFIYVITSIQIILYVLGVSENGLSPQLTSLILNVMFETTGFGGVSSFFGQLHK